MPILTEFGLKWLSSCLNFTCQYHHNTYCELIQLFS
nr:MAG TPA: hypothetical protein [Caudoviricetes sp.]